MKRKLASIIILVVAVAALGSLFFWNWLLGFVLSKYVAGKSPQKPGRLKSVVIPILSWRLHLHHWLYSVCLMSIFLAFNIHIVSPMMTYGILGGVIFQGVYYYNDWHVIITSRR